MLKNYCRKKQEEIVACLRRYVELVHAVEHTLQLNRIWDMRLLFDVGSVIRHISSLIHSQGNELLQLLHLKKGPQVGLLMHEQALWMLRMGCTTDQTWEPIVKTACLDHLQTKV